MSTFRIEGAWTGYSSSQRRVVHREYTQRKAFAEAVRKLGYIRYSDGTSLVLTVTQDTRHWKKRETPINGYTSLIRDCLHHGVNSVEELQAKKPA